MPSRPQRIFASFRLATALLLAAAAALAGESEVRWKDATPSVTEGSGPLTTELMVTPKPSSPVTVVWATRSESATAGVDFVGATTTTVIPAGENKLPVTVQIINDAYNRGSRAFGLEIISVVGASFGNQSYVHATITDDDTAGPPATAPAVAWTPASTTVPSGAGATAFTMSLAYAWTSSISVQWQTNAHSASAGSDFAAASGTLTFAPGETTKDAIVTILPSATPGRQFGLQILAIAGGAWGNPNYQTITITGAQLPAATPAITPAGGLYQADVTAAATSATADAVLRYRLDGQTPNPADPQLPAAGLAIGSPATLAVRAFKSGMQASATATATYAFAVAPLSADVAAGTYDAVRSVTLSTASPGVTIRYTLDGSEPDAGSAAATGAVTIDRSATLKAVGMRDGWTSSPVQSLAYELAVAPVTVDLPAGTHIGAQSVTLTTATAGAAIRYTLDGTAPGPASPLAEGAIALPGSCTLKAVALRDGWTSSPLLSAAYVLRVPQPTTDPAPGVYYQPLAVTAAVDLAGAAIRYTTDGTTPVATSPLWPDAGYAVDRTTALRLRGFRDGWAVSPVRHANYTLKVSPVAASPSGGTYIGARDVTLSTITPGAVIRYTLDGSVPTAASPVATGPIAIAATTVLRAVASRDGWADSSGFRTTYTIRVAPVVADLPSGTYVGQRSVGLSCATPGAAIRYTLDGSVPDAGSLLYAGPILLPGTCTLKAVAMQDGLKSSAVLGRTYRLRVEPVTATLPAGTYVGVQTVELSTPTAGAEVRYTLDGSVPTAASALASGPIELSGNRTLRAVALRGGWLNSVRHVAVYKLRVPAPSVSPAAGTYAAWPLVAAACSDPAAIIRYTTGSGVPGSGSAIFPAGGLQLSAATTLNLVATRTGWTVSLPTSAAYARDQAPVAAAVSAATDEDAPVAITPAASDPDTATVTWSVAAAPAHGTLSGFDPATGAATYTPDADWSGTDSYLLAVADATTSVPVVVSVAVRPLDDPAVAVIPAGLSVLPGSDVVIDIAVNDADSAELVATLTASGGSVRLPAAAGLAVVAGDPATGSPTVGVRGPVSAVATALRAVVLHADDGAVGATLALALADPAGATAAWTAPVAAAVPAAHAVSADGQSVIAAIGAARRLAGDRQQWLVDGDRLATGSYAVDTAGAAAAALEYDLDVAAAGTYLVWLRAGAAAPATAAMGVCASGVASGAVVVAGVLPAGAWSNSAPSGGETAVSFPAPGRYRLRLEAPASAVGVDAVLLLRDDAGLHADGDPWLPDGDGTTIVIDAGAPAATVGAAGRRWQVAPVAGRAAVRSLPDIGGWSDPASPADAHAEYDALFMRAGTYRVWILGANGDEAGNSLHLGLDGQPLASARGLSWLGTSSWIWSSWSSWTGTPTIDIATPGVHTLQVWSREDGTAISQIRLSLVSSWSMPSAAVPATPRGLPYLAAADGTLALSPAGAHEARAAGAASWTAIAGGGGGARQLLPDAGLNFGTAQAGTSPRLAWHAHFPAAGTYRFWVRAVGPAATGDSLFFGLDNAIGTADLSWLPVDPTLAAWGWSSRLGGTAGNAVIVVPAAGYHTVQVWGREDGLALDRVLIQPAAAAAPTAAGPADSPRGAGAPSAAN